MGVHTDSMVRKYVGVRQFTDLNEVEHLPKELKMMPKIYGIYYFRAIGDPITVSAQINDKDSNKYPLS